MSKNLAFNLAGGYGKTGVTQFNAERTVNMYVVQDPLSESNFALYPTDGLQLAHTFTRSGFGRLLFQFKDYLFAVVGAEIYILNKVITENHILSIYTDRGFCQMAASAKKVLLVDGNAGWLYDEDTGTFTKQIQADFPPLPISVEFFGRRFIIARDESNIIQFSDDVDYTSWPAANTFVFPANEEVIALKVFNGRLYVFGNRLTQIWYDAGAPPPDSFRKEQTDLEFGCAAPGSVAKGQGYLMWLSKNEEGVSSVVITTGGRPIAVTSGAIEEEFQSYSTVEDATAFISKNEYGHIFYQINFPTANKSWLYRIDGKLTFLDKWTELTYKKNNRHLANAHIYYNNKHYVLDHLQNKMYERSLDFFDDDGVAIHRLRDTATLRLPNLDRFCVGKLRLDINVGESADGYKLQYAFIVTTDDEYFVTTDDEYIVTSELDTFNSETDAQIWLTVSRDGGKTFGKTMKLPLGRLGQYKQRVEFWNLGVSDRFIFRIEQYHKIRSVLLGATISIAGVE